MIEPLAPPAAGPQSARTPPTVAVALGVLRLIIRGAFRLRIERAELVPRGPYLLAANHLGYLDSLILAAFLPRVPRVHLIGNQDNVWGSAIQARIIDWHGGIVPVDLKRTIDVMAFRRAMRVLQQGGALVVFPEADTSKTEGELLPFRPGAVALAQRAGVPLLPAAFNGTGDIWLRKELRVVFGAPYVIPQGREALATATEELPQRIQGLLDAPRAVPPGPKPLRHFLTHLL